MEFSSLRPTLQSSLSRCMQEVHKINQAMPSGSRQHCSPCCCIPRGPSVVRAASPAQPKGSICAVWWRTGNPLFLDWGLMIFWHIFLITMVTPELQYLLSPHSCIYPLNRMPTTANNQVSFRTGASISSHKIWHSSQLLNGKSQSFSTLWPNSQHLHICFPTHFIYF